MRRFRIFFSLLIIFVFAYCVAVVTPFHSDDFWYGAMGLSWKVHYDHYMNWSGRVVADYISCLLLSIDSRVVIAFIKALSTTLFFYLIGLLPAMVLKKRYVTWVPLVVFMAYWLNNSTLGETTFWIVGAAVYFFTSIFALVFLCYYVEICEKQNLWYWIVGFVLGILAGCSVECLAVALIPCFGCIVYLLRHQGRNINYNGTAFMFLGLCVGVMILLLSPGSYQRLLQDYSGWLAMPVWDKITIKLNAIVGKFPIIYFQLLKCGMVTWFLLWYSNNLTSFRLKNKACIVWSLLFIGGAFVSVFSMVCSPTLPLRAWHATTVFLMIAFSFFFYCDFTDVKCKVGVYLAVALILFIPFVQSYAYVLSSYSAAKEQEILRLGSIQYHKERGDLDFSIPRYYFPALMKETDRFDAHHTPKHYGKYFGVNTIGVQDVDFDYSKILHYDKIKRSNGFKIYMADRHLIHRNGVVIVESLQKIEDRDNLILAIKDENKYRTIIKKYKLVNWIELSGKYYSGIALRNFRNKDYAVEVINYR